MGNTKNIRMYFNTENGREMFINGKERYIGDIVIPDNDKASGIQSVLIGNKHNV
jgi:hypothetical protein